jgi:hypothetical protein
MTRAQARGLAGAGLQDTGLQLRIGTVKADWSIFVCDSHICLHEVKFPHDIRSRSPAIIPSTSRRRCDTGTGALPHPASSTAAGRVP